MLVGNTHQLSGRERDNKMINSIMTESLVILHIFLFNTAFTVFLIHYEGGNDYKKYLYIKIIDFMNTYMHKFRSPLNTHVFTKMK